MHEFLVMEKQNRRTTADAVFDALHKDILSLKILPGTKLSEADVARRLGVSRQPVRDAFNRLSNLDLLLIRPQKATVVRGFSAEHIRHARFVRLALELEVVRDACAAWGNEAEQRLGSNLLEQQAAIDAQDVERFHALDQVFHEEICVLAGHPMAVQTIRDSKSMVDRLCTLSFAHKGETATLLEDHRNIAQAIASGFAEDARSLLRQHLSRLDHTIEKTQFTHPEYFE